MKNDQNYFFYPEDLKQKTLFFGWTGVNLAIIAGGAILAAFIFFLTFIWFPLLCVLIYMILTFTVQDQSAAKTLQQYMNYLFLDQLYYTWGETPRTVRTKKRN